MNNKTRAREKMICDNKENCQSWHQIKGGREGENSTKSQGGLYNMPQNPTLPPKWPRSGVTFQLNLEPTTLSYVRTNI